MTTDDRHRIDPRSTLGRTLHGFTEGLTAEELLLLGEILGPAPASDEPEVAGFEMNLYDQLQAIQRKLQAQMEAINRQMTLMNQMSMDQVRNVR